MKKFICFLLVIGALLPLSVQAKPYHFTSVRWIVANRNKLTYDDRYVTIIGHVTRRMGDEEYWFTDGTGSVRLDSENFDLPINRRIVVGGRIDEAYLGFGHIEVDVRAWHYAPLRHVVVITHRAPTVPATHVPTTAPATAPVSEQPPVTSTSGTTTSTMAPAATTPVSAPSPVPMTNAVPTLAPPAETTPVSAPTASSAPAMTPAASSSPASTNAAP
jgi:uncharacterized protein YdeI (BOF family)